MNKEIINKIKKTQKPFFDTILLPKAEIACNAIMNKKENGEYQLSETEMDAIEYLQQYGDYCGAISRNNITNDSILSFSEEIIKIAKAKVV